MTPIRTRGDLVRTANDGHAIVLEVDRRKNTATLHFHGTGVKENVSWWDLKAPTEFTMDLYRLHPARYDDMVWARVVPRPVLVS